VAASLARHRVIQPSVDLLADMTEGQDHLQHSPTVRDHWWWRPGWRQGRRAYTFHVVFDGGTIDGADQVQRLVREYQAAVSDLGGLDSIPVKWIHLTVQGVGFVDEVDERDVEAVLAAARQRCAELAPFELTFERAIVSDEGIMLPGAPITPAAALRRALRAGIGDVWGEAGVPEGEAFIPHVSVAYSSASGSAARFVQAVEASTPQPATVAVRAASLIVLDRDARMYRWRPYASVVLGRG
jgi:2'-5' RNA ligase